MISGSTTGGVPRPVTLMTVGSPSTGSAAERPTGVGRYRVRSRPPGLSTGHVLPAVLLSEGGMLIRTPTDHVFEFKSQGATASGTAALLAPSK